MPALRMGLSASGDYPAVRLCTHGPDQALAICERYRPLIAGSGHPTVRAAQTIGRYGSNVGSLEDYDDTPFPGRNH